MEEVSGGQRLWAVGSGWEGPFQLECVLVAAPDPDEAMRRAEAAFGAERQPVCRAKMRLRDLGPLDAGLLVGPITGGASLLDGGLPSERRCAPEASVGSEHGEVWPSGQ